MTQPTASTAPPRLELSGPKLAVALESLVSCSDEQGGIERYVEALKLKAKLFGAAFAAGRVPPLAALKQLLAHVPTVRRRISGYLGASRFDLLCSAIVRLLEGIDETPRTDARIAEFCRAFPEDRAHRWVRDLAAEILHNVDPERYPLMCRWVWDARTNTGMLREIWHGENLDLLYIDVPDRYETFLALREELAQYLSKNGVFRDVIHYVDLLTAQVYAHYISEQGGHYLRTDFATPQDPMGYTRRLLGLDGGDAKGRTRLKTDDGDAAPEVNMLS